MEVDYTYVGKKEKAVIKDSLIDNVFSWSLEDIFDEDLYKDEVEKIPKSFQTVEHYLGSYVFPLLEETRAKLASEMEIIRGAPFGEVIYLDEAKPYGTLLYDVKIDYWRNRVSDRGEEPYRTLPGDILVFLEANPENVSDLQRVGWTWNFASVTKLTVNEREDNSLSTNFEDAEDEREDISTNFKVTSSNDLDVKDGMKKSLFVVFLMNITTNKRIWNALHMFRNLKIVKDILCTKVVDDENCYLCSLPSYIELAVRVGADILSKLNESQTEAILSALHRLECSHKSSVELIWGPPGTGKTKIVSVMLFTLLKMNYRTLMCAPTNVALREVASRVVKLVTESLEAESVQSDLFCSLGDILLIGNKYRLKVGLEIEDIYLDYRVKRLAECTGPLTGWRHCLSSMIDFLQDCVSQYHVFVENELIIARIQNDEGEAKKVEVKSFLEFVRDRFKSISLALRRCTIILCIHLPRRFLGEQNFQHMKHLNRLLDSLETLLFQDNVVSDELERIFSHQDLADNSSESIVDMLSLLSLKNSCLSVLKTLCRCLGELGLPNGMNIGAIIAFCHQMASMIFCTASSSYKLHIIDMEPLNLLVIDEASQLKECESIIPLQLPGISHAVLIGDECQLPATVLSKVSDEAGFGRSLFQRLSSLGHYKKLLNMQYRMHPSISTFPNSKFYFNQILDAPNVKSKRYERHYLPGPMFGPYSFINVIGGKEELDDASHSLRNMVEVAIVMKILHILYKACASANEKLSIGVISPYTAQVVAIRDKLGRKYETLDGFVVKVKSIDGFQGGEEDIVILSTVRSNNGGSIGFISSPQRTNVSLTRSRHCLWILGNERTLTKSESVWEVLVRDAKDRQCFFNADEDDHIAKTIVDAKRELDQLDDLLDGHSVLFKSARWKVVFSDNFKKSFQKLKSSLMKKSVINLLLKLSSGWRPKRKVDSVCEFSSQIMKQFKVEGFYVVCTIDIVKDFKYIQVLKVWDILPLEEIPKLERRLDGIFAKYTDEFINRCKEKCLEGDLEVPKSWVTSYDIVRFKDLGENEFGANSSTGSTDGRSYVENSKVSESLLLMKFYSLSSGVVNHLLSDGDGQELDLPFEVTDEEMEIIQFCRSTFVLGRSGTGKTTILTMKLFQKEQQHYIASEGFYAAENSTMTDSSLRKEVNDCIEETKRTILRQLFVTVSSKLCHAVKHHVNQLTSFVRGGRYSLDNSLIDVDDIVQFKDIPDTFVDIPMKKYPLVITFHKFIMMLDGSLGSSYFERFHDVRKSSHDKSRSLRSVELQTFIRTREVNYDRFCSVYWPHFNNQVTKKLDPSQVFTQIISHIKGGIRTGEALDYKLHREDYVSLAEGRMSTLGVEDRERIYDIFQHYEKMKIVRGDFDLADLVCDLHHRLKNENLEGEKMDFVYIDEVQDLTLKQIALFKYICRNVVEGFVFSGDTAQTIARGIDFRFEDIRSLFYNDFILQSGNCVRKEKGLISEIFNLRQNFRTHAGVLKLSQSVIDLLCHFFPQSIDVLKPETSLIYGEAPVLLESGNDDNAIVTIFGNSGNVGGKLVGFGAEQVILVRDDSARMEISDYIGKQALVLTILECKGLEFQDVLLYNFFGSSPLRNHWRVLYEYMKKQDLLDSTLPKFFPSFSPAKHNILCSELKQLYVAITRTRQRLWICENTEDLSKPMFDFWKKKCFVQVRKLDDSLAQAMQVASSPEEWKARGIKLYWENNYEMATICFERAGDTMWEKRAKAAGLKAAADRMRGSNPELACTILREAAEIFDSIGRAESAAECFCDLGDYERAGNIYMEKCGKSELKKAGECFTLAGCHERAAEVYAKGQYFSDCLAVCTKGKFFDLGLKYIEYWKQFGTRDNDMVKRNEDLIKIEQEFLESCAHNYYEIKDNKSMLKFVRAFRSMDLRRNFLKCLDCLDELLLLEEESGNFVEAAEIAKVRGDLLLEADLLGKAKNFKEASLLILWCVFSKSLWQPHSQGWPLKQFKEKDGLLSKAKLFAKSESDLFYEFVCTEVEVLSHEEANLPKLKQYFHASQNHNSLRGKILSVWKILEAHLQLNASKYEWKDELPVDLRKHSEDKISQNHVSIETLVYFWNLWKEYIVNIFDYLGSLETGKFCNSVGYADFCLNYFGVRMQLNNVNITYSLAEPDADWVKKIDGRSIRKIGKLVSVDACHFVSAARKHCCSELLSVGMNVLRTLEALHKFSTRNSFSMFCQCMPLLHIFQVAKFLLKSNFLDRTNWDNTILQNFLQLSTQYFVNIFPLDCRKSLREDMFSLRGTELSMALLEEVILQNISIKDKLSYGQIGRVVTAWFGSGKPTDGLYKKIEKRFEENLSWKALIQYLNGNIESKYLLESPSNTSVTGNIKSESSPEFFASISVEIPSNISLVSKFLAALQDTYNANWRKEIDYISPNCFLYLVDRLLMFAFNLQGFFFIAKSSFLEWLIYQKLASSTNECQSSLSLGWVYDSVVSIIQQFLYNRQDMEAWIEKSKINLKYYYPLLVSRLVIILCLICLNSGKYFDVLAHLRGRTDITSQLPRELFVVLGQIRKTTHVNVNANEIAGAFKRIGDPLVIVSLGKDRSKLVCPDAIFVDMGVTQCTEDIIGVLFPKNTNAPQGKNVATDADITESCKKVISLNDEDQGKIFTVPSSNVTLGEHQNMSTKKENDRNMKMNWAIFQELSDALEAVENGKDENFVSFKSNASKMKVEVEKILNFIIAAVPQSFEKESDAGELKQLCSALDTSYLENNFSGLRELLNSLLSNSRIETLLNRLSSDDVTRVSTVSDAGNDKEESSKYEESNKSDEANLKDSQACVGSKSKSNSNNQATDSKKVKRNRKNKKGKGRNK